MKYKRTFIRNTYFFGEKMEKLLPILNDLLIVMFNLIIFTKMTVWKKNTLCNKIIVYTGCAVILAAYFTATYCFDVPASLSAALCMTLPSLVLFWIFSECKDSRFFLTFCFVDTVTLIIGFYSRYAGILTGKIGNYIMLFVTVALFSGILCFGRRHFKKYAELLRVEKAGWLGMMLSSFLIYFVLIFSAAYPRPLIERIEYAPAYALFGAVVLCCYAVFIQSIVKTKKIYEQYKQLEKEKKFHEIAYTDSLTGLYNRASYLETLNNLERRSSEFRYICCVVLDINDFKTINDRFGHHVGDETLKAVANAVRCAFAEYSRYIFRIGGDEFVALLPDCAEEEVNAKLARLEEFIKKLKNADGSVLSVASGYRFLVREELSSISLETAFIDADKNMYENKQQMKKISPL